MPSLNRYFGDTPEYCLQLLDRVSELVRLATAPVPRDVTDLTTEGTQKAMATLLSQKKKPTAVLCFNDNVALDAIQFAQKKKLKINKDISFVSFANQPLLRHTAFPPVATIEQFPYQQAQKATEVMLDLLSNRDSRETTSFNKISVDSQLAIHKQK